MSQKIALVHAEDLHQLTNVASVTEEVKTRMGAVGLPMSQRTALVHAVEQKPRTYAEFATGGMH